MSILSSMRKVSYVEFLKQTSALASEIREWAHSQSPKDREFGVKKLYELAEDAYVEAFSANNFYPNTVDAINYRIQHFKLAQTHLHSFNAQLSLLRQGAKTHWTMFIIGGLCFLFCGSINELFEWDTPLWFQMLICSVGITVIEFISGIVINIIFKMNVWDYSNLPFNVMGQVCLYFSVLWFFISLIAILADDWLRYLLFDEEKPHYKIL